MAAGIATNCGDTYNDKEVIQAAKDGRLDMANLDNVCRTMLRMMFRNELFEKRNIRNLWIGIRYIRVGIRTAIRKLHVNRHENLLLC